MFLYSFLKSAANAILKLMSAVIAIAHVLFVSMKSLSVSIMLLEYSFGKLKYDSTTLLMSGFLGSSPVSASKSSVSLAILNFLLIIFSVWVSPISTRQTKIYIDVPVDLITEINLKLDAGMRDCPSWAAQEGSSHSFFFVFHAHTVYILNHDTGLLWVRRHLVQPFQDTQIRVNLFVRLLLLVVKFYLGFRPVIDSLLVAVVDYVYVL